MKNECPLENLEKFTELCDLMPGDAKNLYKCLKPDSLTTWGEVKKLFLDRFFPSVRTQDWR